MKQIIGKGLLLGIAVLALSVRARTQGRLPLFTEYESLLAIFTCDGTS